MTAQRQKCDAVEKQQRRRGFGSRVQGAEFENTALKARIACRSRLWDFFLPCVGLLRLRRVKESASEKTQGGDSFVVWQRKRRRKRPEWCLGQSSELDWEPWQALGCVAVRCGLATAQQQRGTHPPSPDRARSQQHAPSQPRSHTTLLKCFKSSLGSPGQCNLQHLQVAYLARPAHRPSLSHLFALPNSSAPAHWSPVVPEHLTDLASSPSSLGPPLPACQKHPRPPTNTPQVGSVVFSGDRPKNYNFIIESADKDENIRVPAVANITDEMRTIMPLTPDWTYWPDYDRVSRAGSSSGPAGSRRRQSLA